MILTYCPKCDDEDFMKNVTTREGSKVHWCTTCDRKYIFMNGVIYELNIVRLSR